MKLKDYMAKYGMKQNFFARKIGISEASLTQLLKEGHYPSIFTAIAIEDATGGEVSIREWADKVSQYKAHEIKKKHASTDA